MNSRLLVNVVRQIGLMCFFINPFALASADQNVPETHALQQHQHVQNSISRPITENGGVSNNTSRNITVRRTEEVHLVCDVAKDNATAIRWYHNDIEVVDFHHRYARNITDNKIKINNVRLEDEGNWNCVVEHKTGMSINIVVLDEPKQPYLLIGGRQLDPGNSFIPIKENGEINLQCIVEGGNPPPKIRWTLKPSVTTLHNSDIIVSDEMNVLNTPMIQLLNESAVAKADEISVIKSEAKLSPVLRAHHNATISCEVSHLTLNSPVSASVLLDVKYTPSFGISRIPPFGFPITEGISVSLKCDVDSNPPSNPIWQKDNGPPPVEQSVDGYLNFTAITVGDSGWYKCITRHFSAEYSSIGYFLNVREPDIQFDSATFPEELLEEGSAVEVTLGGEVQLECPAGSVSCWGRSKYPGQRLEPLGPGPKLTLGNVVYQEAGEYKCFVGKNSKMEKWRSRSVQVNVMGSPVIYPNNKTITVVTNQRVTFALEFCANPPHRKVFWVRHMKALKPGTMLDDLMAHELSASNTQHCHKAEFTINSVQTEHSGEYLFVVMSEKGTAGATILLNVTISKSLTGDEWKSKSVPRINNVFLVFFLAHFCLRYLLDSCITK